MESVIKPPGSLIHCKRYGTQIIQDDNVKDTGQNVKVIQWIRLLSYCVMQASFDIIGVQPGWVTTLKDRGVFFGQR